MPGCPEDLQFTGLTLNFLAAVKPLMRLEPPKTLVNFVRRLADSRNHPRPDTRFAQDVG